LTERKLGLIAGGGDLPHLLLAACRAAGREVFVLALKGHTRPELVSDVEHAWIRIGDAAHGFDILREAGVEDIVLAGPVQRPTLAELRPSWRTARYLARIGVKGLGHGPKEGAVGKGGVGVGDDGLLKALIAELELEGFRVLGAHTILAGLLAEEGAWGAHRPDAQALADIARGIEVARALGAVDVGQAVVVQHGIVLGVEAAEGTDQLLSRCTALRRDGLGGVLVKIAKPRQERRADLPAIGPDTIAMCTAAGLRGVAVEAKGAIVLDRGRLIDEADRSGLFVCGIAVSPPPDTTP
jgi:DUF1009 family protein